MCDMIWHSLPLKTLPELTWHPASTGFPNLWGGCLRGRHLHGMLHVRHGMPVLGLLLQDHTCVARHS